MTSVQHDLLLGTELMHKHESADISDLVTTLDPRYLKLDQSTPQTTVGTFTFPIVVLGANPTQAMQATTKQYVDNIRDIDGGTFFDTYIDVQDVDGGTFI